MIKNNLKTTKLNTKNDGNFKFSLGCVFITSIEVYVSKLIIYSYLNYKILQGALSLFVAEYTVVNAD